MHVRRLVSATATTPASQRAFAGERQARADDGLQQRRPVRREQRRVHATAAIVRYDKTRDRRHAPHRLRPGRVPRRRHSPATPTGEARPRAASIRICSRTDQLAGYEVAERFYEIGSHRRARRHARAAAAGEGAPMSYARQHLDEAKRVIDGARCRRDRERSPTMLAAVARARRPAVLPRRRRQRRRTARTRSTTFARSPASRRTRRPTTSSELTARTNDEGWATVFVEWLRGSRLRRGRRAVRALGRRRQRREEHQPESRRRARSSRARSARAIVGIVGRDGGYTRRSPMRAS